MEKRVQKLEKNVFKKKKQIINSNPEVSKNRLDSDTTTYISSKEGKDDKKLVVEVIDKIENNSDNNMDEDSNSKGLLQSWDLFSLIYFMQTANYSL